MLVPTRRRSSDRQGDARRSFPRSIAIAVALLALAVAGSPRAPTTAAGARAPTGLSQVVPTEPGLTVSGVGRASRPAETATVQILVGTEDAGFGFSEVETSEGSFGSSSASVRAEAVGGTPEAGPDRFTEAELAPILDAIEATGIDPAAVEILASPLAPDPYSPRTGGARLDLEVPEPTTAGMAELVGAVSDAAADGGFVVQVVGVRYDVADCAGLEAEAFAAAVADARARAERLALPLAVTLGGVIAARAEGTPEGDDGGCGGNRSGSYYDSGYGGLGVSLPPFDPALPAEVAVASVVSVSFAIDGPARE